MGRHRPRPVGDKPGVGLNRWLVVAIALVIDNRRFVPQRPLWGPEGVPLPEAASPSTIIGTPQLGRNRPCRDRSPFSAQRSPPIIARRNIQLLSARQRRSRSKATSTENPAPYLTSRRAHDSAC